MKGYLYTVRMAPTALTAAKTLIQIKTGAAPIDIVMCRVYQVTKTTSELLNLLLNQYTSAPTFATVTSFTPTPLTPTDPAALAVGGASATGVNATVEPSGGTVVVQDETDWNVINGEWLYLPIPEARIRIKQGGLGFALKLNTAPVASMTIGAICQFMEWQ